MDSNILEEKLHDMVNHRKIEYSVLSENQLINIKLNILPAAFIVNTETAWQEGAHWLAIFIPKAGPAEFFDSLGNSPIHYDLDFQTFLLQEKPCFMYNTHRLQNFGSDLCGLFCLYFIEKRIQNISFHDILSKFSSNLLNNEQILSKEFPEITEQLKQQRKSLET